MIRRLLAALSTATMLISPAFAFTSGDIVTYSDTTGAHVQDSGILASAAVLTNSNAVLNTLAIGTDQFSGVFGSTNGLVVGFAQNVLLGELVNNAIASSNILPVATTGACKVTTNSNICFGVYGRGEARWSGTGGAAIGAEFTTANFTLNNPDTTLPPNGAFGLTTSELNGIHVTCGAGQGETKDCSVGVYVTSETGSYSNPAFNTGEYLGLYRQYGLYIDAMTSGTQTGEVIKGNGNGIVLQLSTTAEPSSSNAVLTIQNHLSQNLFGVREDGNLTVGTTPSVSVSCAANTVVLSTFVVTNGVVTHC